MLGTLIFLGFCVLIVWYAIWLGQQQVKQADLTTPGGIDRFMESQQQWVDAFPTLEQIVQQHGSHGLMQFYLSNWDEEVFMATDGQAWAMMQGAGLLPATKNTKRDIQIIVSRG
jgi:predicted PurR-regulated permease PerM